jgi:hypothetical protein
MIRQPNPGGRREDRENEALRSDERRPRSPAVQAVVRRWFGSDDDTRPEVDRRETT